MKRFLCVLTTAALLLALFTVYPSASSLTKTDDGRYIISTKEELLLFSYLVNGVYAYEGASEPDADAVLTADIVYNEGLLDADGDLNASIQVINTFMPIGYKYEDHESVYSGTFDGAGHTVTGIYINSESNPGVGMFGYTSETAVIKDLNIATSFIKAPDKAGSVVGENRGTVENCTVSNTVQGDSADNGVGGVVGINYGTVIGCDNSGKVSASGGYAGGIVGQSTGTVFDCKNTNGVFIFDGYAGGIVGHTTESVGFCQNGGEISTVFGHAGGIAAVASGIHKCINTGDVVGVNRTGGVVGELNGDMSDSLSYGDIYVDTDSSDYYGVGMLAGVHTSGSITNSFYYGAGLSAVGADGDGNTVADGENTVSVTKSQLTSGQIAYSLGHGIGQTLDGTSMPTISSEKVYKVKVKTKGNGTVEGNYSSEYSNSLLTATASDESCVFSGWYRGMICISENTVFNVGDGDGSVEAVFVAKGDANGDGQINAKDVLAYKMTLGAENKIGYATDLDGDGELTAADAKLVSGSVFAGSAVGETDEGETASGSVAEE